MVASKLQMHVSPLPNKISTKFHLRLGRTVFPRVQMECWIHKQRCSHWNFISNLSGSGYTCNRSLEAATLGFSSSSLGAEYSHKFQWITGHPKHRFSGCSRWNFIYILSGSGAICILCYVPTNSVSLHTARKIFIYLLTYLLTYLLI